MGCSVEVIGSIVESPAAGQRVEMAAKKMKILGECSAKVYIPIDSHSCSWL